jgi:hypothetical protein
VWDGTKRPGSKPGPTPFGSGSSAKAIHGLSRPCVESPNHLRGGVPESGSGPAALEAVLAEQVGAAALEAVLAEQVEAAALEAVLAEQVEAAALEAVLADLAPALRRSEPSRSERREATERAGGVPSLPGTRAPAEGGRLPHRPSR